MTKRVLLSAPYMIPVIDRFRPIFADLDLELVVAEVNERLEADQLMAYAGKIDGVICGDDRFNEGVLDAYSPRLRVISKWGTGVDSIDREAAKRLGVKVCNTPGAFTNSVADTVMGYILLFAREIVAIDRVLKDGRWEKRALRALNECTLGVVGVGNIGKAVLRRAHAFGMRLLGNDIIDVGREIVAETGVEMISLRALLPQADFVSLNADLNPTSHHLMSRQTIALMRTSSVLINTSRGPIVEEGALIEALSEGRIAGAALDVYEVEPLPESSPLRQMDNVVLAPHNANSSPAAWERVHWNTLLNLLTNLDLTIPGELKQRLQIQAASTDAKERKP